MLREDPRDNLLPEFMAWGRLLTKIAMALLEKSMEIDFKFYRELALGAFNCLDLAFDADAMMYRNVHFPYAASSSERESSSSEASDGHWPKNLASEIIDASVPAICKVRFGCEVHGELQSDV